MMANRGKWGTGGDGGIRTLDTLNTYDDLANRCLQPLGHVSTGGAFAVILMIMQAQVRHGRKVLPKPSGFPALGHWLEGGT